jgi:hypothetical protein
MSPVAFSRFTFDHLLLGLRGVNRCSQNLSLKEAFWLSIQPYLMATSSASE